MTAVYRNYFQKSRAFLFPLTGLKKYSRYSPKTTYMVWKDANIRLGDYKILVEYENVLESEGFKDYESKNLLTNRYIDCVHQTASTLVYSFDLSDYKDDYRIFLSGKYSKLSDIAKEIITNYHEKTGNKQVVNQWIRSYLSPHKYYKGVADDLGIDVKDLVQVGQLCDIYDIHKETLYLPLEVPCTNLFT